MTFRTGFRRSTLCCTSTRTLFTLNQTTETDFLLAAFCSFHKGKRNINVDIVSSDWCVWISGTAGTAESTESAAAKKAVEDITDISKVKAACAKSAAAAIARVNTSMTKLVITGTFLRIRKDSVSFIYLFEFCFCFFISRVQVWMVLLCQFTVCLFQLIVCASLLYPQHLIIISFFLCHSVHLLFLC